MPNSMSVARLNVVAYRVPSCAQPPDVTVEHVVETGSHAAAGKHRSEAGQSRGADDNLPAAIGPDPDHLAAGRPDVVLPVVAPVLDAGAHIQGALKLRQREDELVQLAPVGAAVENHLPAVRRRPLGVGPPELATVANVDRAGIEVTPADPQFEDRVVVRVAKPHGITGAPIPADGIIATENRAVVGDVSLAAAQSGRAGKEPPLERYQPSIGNDIPVADADARFAGDLEVLAVGAAQEHRSHPVRAATRNGVDHRLGVARALEDRHVAKALRLGHRAAFETFHQR